MTKTYYVATTHNGATTYLQLNRQKPLKVKAKANTKYLIYADDGTFVYNVHLKTAGDDVHVYLPQDNKAILTIEDYRDFVAVNDGNTLFLNNSTLMLTNPLANTVVATPTPSPSPIIASIGAKTTTSIATTSVQTVGAKKASTWALAGLGLVGAGVALAGGNDKDSPSTNSNTNSNTHNNSTNTQNNNSNNTNNTQTDPTPTITINSITDDNVINYKESQSLIKITGTVNHFKDGDVLTIRVGSASQTATVNNNVFSLDLDGKILAGNKEVIVEVTRNGRFLASEQRAYDIDIKTDVPAVTANNEAQIYLNDIKLDLAKEIGSVRLSGKLDFANSDSMYKWGYNKDFVRSMTLKIGTQEFLVGINQNDHSFYLDLTHEQYQYLKGKNISYTLKSYNASFSDLLPEIPYKHLGSDIGTLIDFYRNSDDNGKAELAKVKVSFDNSIIQNGKKLNFNLDDATQISGKAINAKPNDEVAIQIGNKSYTTTIKNDLTFGIRVANSELDNLKSIQATLSTKNNKGEITLSSDSATILSNINVNDTFVSRHQEVSFGSRVIKHSSPNYNFPYFISALEYEREANGQYHKYDNGFLNKNKTPFGGFVDTPPVIKYYFATPKDYNSNPNIRDNGIERGSYREFSEAYKNVFRDAYKQFEKVINLRFVEVNHLSEADSIIMLGNFIRNSSGFAYHGGNIAINTKSANMSNPDERDKYVVLHEIFHTLGATHIDAKSKDTFHHLNYAHAERTVETSIMSYNQISPNLLGISGLRVFDLAYLHYRFGVNPKHKVDNDTYRFQNYSPMTIDGNIYIWDGGGVDTFDASQEKEGVNVNLTPGSWIYRGAIYDSFLIKEKIDHIKNIYTEGQAFIGYGTQLENLIGSNYADILKGNKADNNIFGGAGNDSIDGDDGNDYLDGGQGVDILTGGRGNDIFVVDDNDDVVIERTSQGTDTIYSFADTYTLPSNVEHIRLFATAQNATGNELNNTIFGNDLDNQLIGGLGNDTLSGGRGNDVLIGGAGADTFVFDDLLDGSIDHIIDFNPSDDKIALSSIIFNNLTKSNIQDHIKYDKDTGYVSYHYDNSAIHFATLTARLDGDLINYQII